ncbi:MAG: HupE/UreJ family protein [Cyanobium sp.]
MARTCNCWASTSSRSSGDIGRPTTSRRLERHLYSSCYFRDGTLALAPAASWAHADAHPGGGFVAGFLHPIGGLDHATEDSSALLRKDEPHRSHQQR